jgi:GTP cyclohydrolase I
MTKAQHRGDGVVGFDIGPSAGSRCASADLEQPIEWGHVRPRHLEPDDWFRFQHSIAEIFAAFGMDLDSVATERTPERFLQALFDATAGYDGDEKLLTAFPSDCQGNDCLANQIIEGPISFYALCEHHSLPFHGFAHVGYIADQGIIGISKLTRLVRLFARRFTIQERIGEQVSGALAELIKPHGVAVHLQAVHLCTQMRGVREEHSKTTTTFWRGSYADDPAIRSEFLAEVGSFSTPDTGGKRGTR